MYEEDGRISWTSLFIKLIIVIIFILFTVWLLSLSTKSITKGMSNSLDVLTDNIFSQNVEKMKEVGKSYFTTERLPQKIGEVKTLSLAKMYDENLILEIKDKNGNVCSAKNSYVSVEKMENEYQMKVYLECGEESDYVKVIMGCYNYCDKDICERKDNQDSTGKLVEYEYSKTSGGSWGPYGSWTNWSKTSVSKTNYRDVETKIVKEEYSYDKSITESVYTREATCPELPGYTNTGSDKGVCSYSKKVTDYKDVCAKTYGTNGEYKFSKYEGGYCYYTKPTIVSVNPNTCPQKSGDYSLVNQDGFTCNYSKTTYPTKPASKSGGDAIYGTQCSSVVVGYDTVTPCSGCGVQVIPIYGQSCSQTITGYTPVTYTCPSGYTLSGSTCTSKTGTTEYKTTEVGCPEGYSKLNKTCQANGTDTKKVAASCPANYELRGNSCARDITYKAKKDAVCPTGERMQDGNCYKDEIVVQTITGVRDVKYYRYRLRDYKGGTTDYKWSLSNKDNSLISAGYKLTGKTREIGGK